MFNIQKLPIIRKKFVIALGYYLILSFFMYFFYNKQEITTVFIQNIYALLFLLILPMLLISKGFQDKLSLYYWSTQQINKQLRLGVISIWVVVLFLWFFMLQWKVPEEVISYKKTFLLLTQNLFVVPVGLLSQEFFFRGFLLKSFRDNFNKWFSIVSVAILGIIFSVFAVHKNGDWKVLGGMMIFNIALNIIVWRTKTIIISFFISWIGWLVINFILVYQILKTVSSGF